jgi:protein-disulfide isomerase
MLRSRNVPAPGATQEAQVKMSRHAPFTLTVPVGPTDHVLGPDHAPVTIVEYGDLECPNCRQAAPAVKLLLSSFENKVRVAYRHFPLEGVHPHAELAAEAAECAGEQGKFWEMHDLLLDNQSHLNLPHLKGYAQRLGLDMARFTAQIDDHVYLQRVREHLKSGRDSGVHATPTFFVNGRLQDVSFGLKSLRDAVEAALSH